VKAKREAVSAIVFVTNQMMEGPDDNFIIYDSLVLFIEQTISA
jgi:hypothetical protein